MSVGEAAQNAVERSCYERPGANKRAGIIVRTVTLPPGFRWFQAIESHFVMSFNSGSSVAGLREIFWPKLPDRPLSLSPSVSPIPPLDGQVAQVSSPRNKPDQGAASHSLDNSPREEGRGVTPAVGPTRFAGVLPMGAAHLAALFPPPPPPNP